MKARKPAPTAALVLGYLASVLLVSLYASMSVLWQLLSNALDISLLYCLPVLLCVIMLTAILAVLIYRNRMSASPIHSRAIVGGVFLCVIALVIPDPQFPIKRIHVAEYLTLSLIVRYTMAQRMTGLPLLFFSACFTALLGIHDEFIQGLHPSRTYGLRDLIVNSLSGGGGALIWHGFRLFDHRPAALFFTEPGRSATGLFYLFWLLISVIILAGTSAYFRAGAIPLWLVLPLLGSGAFWARYEATFPPAWKHGIRSISMASLLLVSYPVLTHLGDGSPPAFF